MKTLIKELKKIYDRYLFFHNEEEMVLFLIKCVSLKWLTDHQYFLLDEDTSRFLQGDFTIQGILSAWSKEDRNNIDLYREKKLPLSDTMWNVVQEILAFETDLSGICSNNLGEIYESLLPPVAKRVRAAFYTPYPLAKLMTNMLLSDLQTKRMEGLTVLDPACGGGQLLSAVYDEIIVSSFASNPKEGHKVLLENILHGWDTEPLSLLVSSLVLVFKSDTYVEPRHLRQLDALYLLEDSEMANSYDYIIGNPPYMGHKEVERNYSEELRERYKPVYSDKADISYCFFVLGEYLLKKDGRLVFLTSRYFMEAHNGAALRDFLKTRYRIESLIDFNGIRPIDKVGIDPAIVQLKKDQLGPSTFVTKRLDYGVNISKDDMIKDLLCRTGYHYQSIVINQKNLDQRGWRIINKATKNIIEKIENKSLFYLEDLVESFQGIITGYDRAFIFDQKKEEGMMAWSIVHPWIKNKDVHPYKIDEPGLAAIYPNTIKNIKNYPLLEKRLLPFKDVLMERRECKRGKLPWYYMQWGRDLSMFKKIKIVYPYKAAYNRFAVDTSGYLFSADVYGMILRDLLYVNMDEYFLMLLLNSRLYTYYFQSYAKKLGKDLYEYYPNTLMRLRIPEVRTGDLEKFQRLYQLYAEQRIHQMQLVEEFETWIHAFFELTCEESTLVLKD